MQSRSQSSLINSLRGPQISDLYHKIEINTISSEENINELGHYTKKNFSTTEVNAALQEKSFPETDILGKQTWIQYFIFIVRHRHVSTTDTIVYQNNNYDIISVDNTTYGRNRFTIIKTKRVI